MNTINKYSKGVTIDIFLNYGVLGDEKMNVYTHAAEHPNAVCSDEITVLVPDEWEIWTNHAGQTMVTAPWGWDYTIDEVLKDTKGIPAFCAKDKNQVPHTVYLYTKEELEENMN